MKDKKRIIIPAVMAIGFIACICVAYFSDRLNAFETYEIIRIDTTTPQ